MRDVAELQAFARDVLRDIHSFKWTIQGFGLLRMHMPGHTRLHIWDHDCCYHGVSMIHDHAQWGLESTVLFGQLQNTRYLETDGAPNFNFMHIKAGMGGHPISEVGKVCLVPQPVETYLPGNVYSQQPLEIHMTQAAPGTVTFMQKFPTEDGETARVFWPLGGRWGTAEPRDATWEEVNRFAIVARNQMERYL